MAIAGHLTCVMLVAELVAPDLPSTTPDSERPSAVAARLGEHYARHNSSARKKELGQFFTPLRIGECLAHWATPPSTEAIRVLDPGFGTGILSCCLLEQFAKNSTTLRRIELEAYDVDESLLPIAQEVVGHLTDWLASRGIELTTRLHTADFILAHAAVWQFPLAPPATYDVVIANPPYFKLGQHDPRNVLAGAAYAQPNIYALFAVLAGKLVRPGGELLFLVPRSFSSGPYFARFRRFAHQQWRWARFHLFHSRRAAFKKDAVLQETVLFKAVRYGSANPGLAASPAVIISASAGMHDLGEASELAQPLAELVGPERQGSLLFLPTDAGENALLTRFRSWTHRLADLGVGVSTGPVVAFRAAEWLRAQPAPGALPLLWMDNVGPGGRWRWPLTSRTKPQYLAAATPKTQLVPNRNYVVMRRISAKDDARRIVAAPCLAADWAASHLGFENKLNYLYARRGEFTPVQAIGLAALLSSRPYDQFFRLFNGNTQVSATEARELPVPAWPAIEALGAQVQAHGWDVADQLVADLLQLPTAAYSLPDNFMAEPALPYANPDAELPPKVREAQQLLSAVGMPAAQQNKISAYTLLALASLGPADPWNAATGLSKRVSRGISDFIAATYSQVYKENTRETFRRQVLHQFVQAGLVAYNPDAPALPVNSPKAHYALTAEAISLLQAYGTDQWPVQLTAFQAQHEALTAQYAAARNQQRIELVLPDGRTVALSPGLHNEVQRAVLEQFLPAFAPGAQLLYLGDTEQKHLFEDAATLQRLGVPLGQHSKLPDVVLLQARPDGSEWLFLIEVVTSHGPVSPKRKLELQEMLKSCPAGPVYVTAFPDFKLFKKYSSALAWHTEVWIQEMPGNMIHFNGDRFLGPR